MLEHEASDTHTGDVVRERSRTFVTDDGRHIASDQVFEIDRGGETSRVHVRRRTPILTRAEVVGRVERHGFTVSAYESFNEPAQLDVDWGQIQLCCTVID